MVAAIGTEVMVSRTLAGEERGSAGDGEDQGNKAY